METVQLLRTDGRTTTDQLAAASEQLEAALEDVDVVDERALADAVVAAVRATDRAQRLATERRVRV